MPLTRGRIGGHDNERLAFAFTMMNDDETVQCQISDAAMDELAEVAYSGRASHFLNGAARRFTPGGFFLWRASRNLDGSN